MGVNTHSLTLTHTQSWSQLYATDSVGSSITTIAHWTTGVHCTAEAAAIDTAERGKEGEKGGKGRERVGWLACGHVTVAQATVVPLITFGKRKCKRVLKMPKETSTIRTECQGAMPAGRSLTSWEQYPVQGEGALGATAAAPASFSAIHLARQTFALAILGQYRQISMQI